MPDEEPMLAIVALLIDHVPPDVELVSVLVVLEQTLRPPDIAPTAVALTVTTLVAVHVPE
jgi:hypothetical protein